MQEIKKIMETAKAQADMPVEAEWHIDEDMSKHTTFKTGGRAAALVEVHDLAALKWVLRAIDENKVAHVFLGNGSNTLFRDGCYDGVVVKLGAGFTRCSVMDTEMECGCGLLLSNLAAAATNASLTGLEFASGIPGSLGGAVFMNAGAYGGEMKDVVKLVRAVSGDGRDVIEFTHEEMDFGYRKSILQRNGYIAYQVVLSLEQGDRSEIGARIAELTVLRKEKQPLQYPSAGSTFKRPEGHFAGKLIQDSGLSGVSVGGAQVSTQHNGFIINADGATATDILQLISLVRNTVYDKFGVMLEPEVRIVGED